MSRRIFRHAVRATAAVAALTLVMLSQPVQAQDKPAAQERADRRADEQDVPEDNQEVKRRLVEAVRKYQRALEEGANARRRQAEQGDAPAQINSLAYLSLFSGCEALLGRVLEDRRDERTRRAQQGGEEVVEVEVALPGGTDDAGEDLLGVRTAQRAIAATDFAVDHGGADGVLGPPVGRVDVGGPEEAEYGREFAVEMGGEALGRWEVRRRVDQAAEAREQLAPPHGEPVIGDLLRIASVAEPEGRREHGLDTCRPGTARMVDTEGARPTEQMRQTTLVQRVSEPAIGGPAVADQHPGEVRAQDGGRVVEAPSWTNRIHRRVRRRERPEPMQHGIDAPAGFIGAHDRTAADLGTQRRVGRAGHAGGPMQGLYEAPRGDGQPEALAQQRRDLLERDTDVLVQEHNEGDRTRPQVHVGGAQRVGGLQRMAALDATATGDTAPDLHVEASNDGPDHGEIFLILGGDALQLHRAPTPGTRCRQRGVVGHIDVHGHRAPRAASVPAAGSSAPGPTAALRVIFGKRGRLPEPRAPRRIELALQAFGVPLQPIALTLQARHVVMQTRDLFCLVLDQLVALVVGRTRSLIGHTRFMADSRQKYKYEFVSLTASPAK